MRRGEAGGGGVRREWADVWLMEHAKSAWPRVIPGPSDGDLLRWKNPGRRFGRYRSRSSAPAWREADHYGVKRLTRRIMKESGLGAGRVLPEAGMKSAVGR